MYVVCTMSGSDGIGGTYTVTFDYFNAYMDYEGRGFLGFARKYTQDSRDNILHTENFRQDFPYIGLLSSASSRQPNSGSKIREVTNTYNKHSNSFGGDTRHYPYLSGAFEQFYEVGGPFNGELIRSVTTTNTVDSTSGTTTYSTRTVTEGNNANGMYAGQNHVQRDYHSTLFNDVANWCLGRPTTTQQIDAHALPGGAQITRTMTTSWDGPKCRPTETVREPGSTQWQVTTGYEYDGFGNINRVTVQPAAGQGQANRITQIDWGVNGRFPEHVTNPELQSTTFAWDPVLGLRTGVTDPNHLSVTFEYDNFGRMRHERRPDQTSTE
jgi:YD repeat-containing protein